jgi:hypothetical protein
MLSLRAAYFTLLGSVYDQLPKDAITQTFAANKKLAVTPAKLQNVRRGGTANLELLIKIVKACLPDFVIPDAILAARKKK